MNLQRGTVECWWLCPVAAAILHSELYAGMLTPESFELKDDDSTFYIIASSFKWAWLMAVVVGVGCSHQQEVMTSHCGGCFATNSSCNISNTLIYNHLTNTNNINDKDIFHYSNNVSLSTLSLSSSVSLVSLLVSHTRMLLSLLSKILKIYWTLKLQPMIKLLSNHCRSTATKRKTFQLVLLSSEHCQDQDQRLRRQFLHCLFQSILLCLRITLSSCQHLTMTVISRRQSFKGWQGQVVITYNNNNYNYCYCIIFYCSVGKRSEEIAIVFKNDVYIWILNNFNGVEFHCRLEKLIRPPKSILSIRKLVKMNSVDGENNYQEKFLLLQGYLYATNCNINNNYNNYYYNNNGNNNGKKCNHVSDDIIILSNTTRKVLKSQFEHSLEFVFKCFVVTNSDISIAVIIIMMVVMALTLLMKLTITMIVLLDVIITIIILIIIMYDDNNGYNSINNDNSMQLNNKQYVMNLNNRKLNYKSIKVYSNCCLNQTNSIDLENNNCNNNKRCEKAKRNINNNNNRNYINNNLNNKHKHHYLNNYNLNNFNPRKDKNHLNNKNNLNNNRNNGNHGDNGVDNKSINKHKRSNIRFNNVNKLSVMLNPLHKIGVEHGVAGEVHQFSGIWDTRPTASTSQHSTSKSISTGTTAATTMFKQFVPPSPVSLLSDLAVRTTMTADELDSKRRATKQSLFWSWQWCWCWCWWWLLAAAVAWCHNAVSYKCYSGRWQWQWQWRWRQWRQWRWQSVWLLLVTMFISGSQAWAGRNDGK